MRFLLAFARFWYDFLVGDDWIVAAGVVIALVIAAGLTRLQVPLWWWMPVWVILLLTFSLQRAARAAARR